jgi:hypothetical protein
MLEVEVEVFEAESPPGEAARTMELTMPGFHHDFGSAVHPMAVGSPFFPPCLCMIMARNGSTRLHRWRTRWTMAQQCRWSGTLMMRKQH